MNIKAGKNYRWVLLALLFSAGAIELHAANTNESLRGEVIEANTGEPIPGATVLIEELNRGAAADIDGKFEIRNLSAGSYSLIVRSLGYQSVRLDITHPSDEPLSIRMRAETVRGEDVIVTSSPIGRNIQYQPAQSMNTEMLQQKAAPSLGEILDGSPGVASRSFGSAPARPVIRGMDGDRVLVLQNGERMGDLSATAVDHAVGLDPLAMDRVEVVRGPASLLYGSSAIGGVVNMFSNDMPRQWDTGTSGSLATHVATMNSMGAGLVRAQHGTENFAATGRVIYRNSGDLNTPDGRLPDTSIDNLSYGGGVGYRSGNFETAVSVTGMDYTYGLPEAIDLTDESVEIRMNRVNFQSVSTLKMDRFFEEVELRVQYSDYYHEEIESEINPDGSVDEDLEISFDQQMLSSSLLFRHRTVGNLNGAIGFSFNFSELAVGGDEALTPDADGSFIAGFIYEELSVNYRVTLKGGGRLEYKQMNVLPNVLFPDADEFQNRSDLIFAGAVGLNYAASANWETGFQIARAFRTPGIEELYSNAPHVAAGSYDIGNPNLTNEISIGADAFVKHRSNRVTSELSLFANRIDNYVDFSPTGEIHQPTGLPFFEYNATDALLYGFEISTNYALTNRLQGGLGFDYVRGHERKGDRNNLTFITPFRTHVSLTYDDGSFWLGPRARIVADQNRVAPNEDPTGGYLLLGMDGGYRFGHGISLSVRMDNMLNESYRDHLSRVENRDAPMPGRNVNAMLRWEF